jgi:hypothetical protein
VKKVRRGVKPVGMVDAWGFRGATLPPELAAATARVLTRRVVAQERGATSKLRYNYFVSPGPARDTDSFGEDFFNSDATGLGDFGQTPYDLMVGAPPPTATITGAAAPAAAPSLWSTVQSLMPAAVAAIQKKLAPSAPKASKPKAPKPPKIGTLVAPPRTGLPSWVTPVAIGAGVLVLGTGAYFLLKRK